MSDEKSTMFIQAHQAVFKQSNQSAKLFELMATTKSAPSISVVASVHKHALQLSYFIANNEYLAFTPTSNPLVRQDFLWENHCLECFLHLQNSDETGYFEMNFSPKGFFNLYQFSDYRTPSGLPPVWADGDLTLIQATSGQFDAYHLTLTLANQTTLAIKQINPTAIIYQNGEPIFYAAKHANPPDFHNRAFWQDFN